jgi:cytochrome c oxidase subunit I
VFFAFGLVTVFLVPIIYYSYPVTSAEHIRLFTWLMQYGGSLAALPLSLALVHGLARARRAPPKTRPQRSALLTSMILFGAGGGIGFLIHGSNVTIPAHYHGCIIGVTLAFMGLTYELLPRLGYRPPELKWARIQPWLYGGGQLLHVAGLLWSGGYGVARKVAGSEQTLENLGQIAAMGLMGIGGLIAILGGLLFVVIVARALKPARATTRKN